MSRGSWELRPARAAFAECVPDWDALNARLYASHPLLSSRFVAPLVEHFAAPRDVLAIDADASNLLLCGRSNAVMWASFQPSQAQIAPVLLSDAAALPALMRALPGCNLAFDLFSQDPLYTPFNDEIAAATAEFTRHALTTSVDLSTGFDAYWAGRSGKLRQNINRYIRRAEADGVPARLVVIEDPAGLPAALARYGDLESSGWKGDAGTAIHSANAQGKFYSDVLAAFARDGNATIYELYLGEKLAASRIAIASPRMQVMLKTTYAEEMSKHAPGRILLYFALEHEFARRRSEWIEFYTNAAPELITWSTHTRTIRHVTLYRDRLARRAFAGYRQFRQWHRRARQDGEPVEAGGDAGDTIGAVTVAACADLPASGAKLLKRAGEHNLFLTQGWFDNLATHVAAGSGGTCHVVAQHGNGKVSGILPLWLTHERTGIDVRVLRSLSNYYTALFDIVLDDDRERLDATVSALVDAVCARRSEWDMFVLSPVAEDAVWLPLVEREFARRGYQCSRSTAFVNWYTPLEEPSFARYLAERPSDLRNLVQRKTRKLEREHKAGFRLVTGHDGLAEAMSDYETIYSASWKRREPYPEFIRAFAALCADRQALRLGILEIDGEPAAAQLWFVHDRTASIYKLAFDPRFTACSAGSILSMRLMEHVIEHDRVNEIDFLTGDDPFKKSWMTHSRRRVSLDVFNGQSLRGRVLGWRRQIGEFLRSLDRKHHAG